MAENPEVSHEQGDVNVKVVLWFAAGLVVFAVVLHLGLAWMYFAFRAAEDREKQTQYPEEFRVDESHLPKSPRLEGIKGSEPTGDKIQISREEELDLYGWVDEKKGIVSIPIERAFERLLSKKPKARSARESQRWRDHGTAPPRDASSGHRTKEEP